MQGLVLSGANNFFAVRTPEGNVVRCSIKGKKLKEIRGYYNPLAPGDTVDIEYDTLHPDQGQITALIPRRNGFARWNQKISIYCSALPLLPIPPSDRALPTARWYKPLQKISLHSSS